MNKRVLSILTCVAMLVLVLTVTSFAQEKDALDLVLERGKLVVSTHFGDAPWVYEDPKTGEPTGLIYEITKMYTEEIGVELEMMPFDFAGVIPALISGKVDMIVASLSRTVPRSTKILYTDPYAVEAGSGFAPKGKFKQINELNNEEVRIAVTAGAIEEYKPLLKFVLTIGPGVISGVVANWLYNKLRGKKIQKLIIERTVVEIDKEEIKKIIEEKIKLENVFKN